MFFKVYDNILFLASSSLPPSELFNSRRLRICAKPAPWRCLSTKMVSCSNDSCGCHAIDGGRSEKFLLQERLYCRFIKGKLEGYSPDRTGEESHNVDNVRCRELHFIDDISRTDSQTHRRSERKDGAGGTSKGRCLRPACSPPHATLGNERSMEAPRAVAAASSAVSPPPKRHAPHATSATSPATRRSTLDGCFTNNGVLEAYTAPLTH